MAANFDGVGGPTSPDPDGPDGDRMNWNAWPRSKVEASKCVVPIAASISPIRAHLELITLPYSPLRYKPPCVALLNPYCSVDFTAKMWICPLCFSCNHFSHHYSAISESNAPSELYLQCSTVEYSSSSASATGGAPQPLPLSSSSSSTPASTKRSSTSSSLPCAFCQRTLWSAWSPTGHRRKFSQTQAQS